MAKLSPMMEQYFSIKKKHPDQILFFRLGDFYEMFFEDAKLASKELELTLTGRDCGQEDRAPMCGIPYHSCEAYIQRLIKKGYKVAICEQMEDPALAKGLVKREVVRVITPGTIIETSMLDEGSNNYIGSIFCQPDGYGLCFTDISTGEIQATQVEGKGYEEKLINDLARFSPSELIFNGVFLDQKGVCDFVKNKLDCSTNLLDDEDLGYQDSEQIVLRHFGISDLVKISLDNKPFCRMAVSSLLQYLSQTQKNGLERLLSIQFYHESQYMNLDLTARRNLELIQTLRTGEKRGSLLWVLDQTRTAMGKRMIKSFIEQPLNHPSLINKRLNAVEELYQEGILRQEIIYALGGIFDLDRLMTKVVYGNATPRDLKALQSTAEKIPPLRKLMESVQSQYLQEIFEELDPLEDLALLLGRSICDDPPVVIKEGGVIKEGYNAELDELRGLVGNTKEYIAKIEAREKESTGIRTLKIGYNRIFGYYLEVSKSFLSDVPDTYIRKQTLANCERYITQELKELEDKIVTAGERILRLEAALFDETRRFVAEQLTRTQKTSNAIARLDVFCSLAAVAVSNRYVRPSVDLSDEIKIQDGRHPVVECILKEVPFVANDTYLNRSDRQIAIITGPNMAGKSTYMRQTALIVLMAQLGSFVPATSASIGIVDGIFTRVGASDDLTSGQSTFMVEMNEVAHILKNATRKSLLILDEIGRGTSTFDGMSIARAVLEYIADQRGLGAKTLFATHYHELTDLESVLSCVKNYSVAVKKRGDEITFLRRIIPGGADDSYGIEVSKLAGIPDQVIERAHEILSRLEKGELISLPKSEKRKKTPKEELDQMVFLPPQDSALRERLARVDLNALTPIEALNILFELKAMLK